MAIYDINGTELDVAYSLNGVALGEAYDIDGNPLYEDDPEVIDDIDLSDVESYFVQPVRDAMAYVKNLGTRGWVHHIVLADTHNKLNYGHSSAIVSAMQSSNYFSKVIHLGDLIDSNATGNYADGVAAWGQFNGDMLFCIGNHDVGVSDWATAFYDSYLSNDTDIVVDQTDISRLNYYWDDTKHRIRYIIYNFNDSTGGGTTYAQNKIDSTPSGYGIVTLCHYKDKVNGFVPVRVVGKGINYIGNICGHWHIDEMLTQFGGIYNQVLINNDGHINDDANYPKTDGTVNSQAITIMSINQSTRVVKFYRIGIPTTLGSQWEYTYPKNDSVDGWYEGFYWGLGGQSTSYEGCWLCTKKYPVKDSNNNTLQYSVTTTTGALTELYVLGLDANGNVVQRKTIGESSTLDNTCTFNSSTLGSSAVTLLISLYGDNNIEKAEDIIVTAV